MSTVERVHPAASIVPLSISESAEEVDVTASPTAKSAFLNEYKALLKRVKGDAHDPGHHLELARFYIKHQYLRKAHSSLQVAKALQPRRLETHYLLGWLYQKEANWEQARLAYRQILRLKPNEPLARFHLGETFLAMNQKEQAYESLLKATELEPNLAQAYWHLGRLALERRDHNRAMTHFQTLKNLDPANPDVYCELGAVFKAQSQPDRAVMAYQKAIEMSPGHVGAQLALARVYLDGGAITKSLAILESLVTREATAPEAYLLLSQAYQKVGKVPQAQATLLQLQKAFPGNPRGHAELARLYFLGGEHELAEEEFLKAIDLSPDDKELYVALGTLYLNLKAPSKAIHLYRDSCARFPDDPQIYSLLGEVYDRFDHPDESVEAFSHAITGDPESETLYCKRAKLYVKLGKYNEALRDFERARAIDPACPEAKLDTELIRTHKKYQEAFSFYSKGMDALKAGNYQQAMGFYRQVLKLVPNNVDWLKEFLQITLYTGQFPESLATYEKLVALAPTSGDLYRGYADLQYQLLQYEQSRGLYERCVALAPGDVEGRIGLIRCLRHKLIDRSLSPGKFEALVTAYEGHLTSSRHRNLALLELAHLHVSLGYLVEPGGQWATRAIELIDKIGPQESDEIARRKQLALHELHLLAGNGRDAIAALERLQRTFPHNPVFAHALLENLMEDRQDVRAFRLSEEFRNKFPDNGLLRSLSLKLFALVASSKDNPKSLHRAKIRALQQYVAANPRDWMGFFDLGMGLVYLTRPNEWFESRKKASIAFNKAKQLEPGSPWPWWGLVKMSLHDSSKEKLGVAERDRTIAILRNAINLFPSEPGFHYYLGRVLHRSGDPEKYEEGTRSLITASILGDRFAPASFDLAVHYHSAQDYTRAYHHYLAVCESVLGGRYYREVQRRIRSLIP